MADRPDEEKVKLSVDEDFRIVARLDAIAEAEGTSRAALVRRAIRQLVFSSPALPAFGNIPEPTETINA